MASNGDELTHQPFGVLQSTLVELGFDFSDFS